MLNTNIYLEVSHTGEIRGHCGCLQWFQAI